MKERKPDISIECPNCFKTLTRYSCSNLKSIGNSCYSSNTMGYCPNCRQLFTWEERFHIYLASKPMKVQF